MTRVIRTPAPSLVGWPRTLRATPRTCWVAAVVEAVVGLGVAMLTPFNGGRRAQLWPRPASQRYDAGLARKQALGWDMLTTRIALATMAVACFATQARAQDQDFSAVQIETQKLADGLFMLIGSGGNIALSTGPDGSVLVDTQYAPLNAKILAAVRAAGGTDVKYVINTHWHG